MPTSFPGEQSIHENQENGKNHSVVLGVLLYEAEIWVTKRAAIRKLESFNKCVSDV